jgi:signal transduction histidine kinase
MTLALAELPPATPRPAGFGEYLRIIDHEVHRCRRIAEGLLNFSRAKAVQRVRLDLDDVVEQTLALLKHHTRFKRCPVRLDLTRAADEAGPAVHGDPDQLTQVLMVLLLNAADAVAEAPPRDLDEAARGVTLRTRRTAEGEAVLDVDDEGVGIAPDARDKLFEPFYTTKAPGEGTGLGLSIAYGIVRDLGGRLEVDSVPGAGSRFRLVLPAA